LSACVRVCLVWWLVRVRCELDKQANLIEGSGDSSLTMQHVGGRPSPLCGLCLPPKALANSNTAHSARPPSALLSCCSLTFPTFLNHKPHTGLPLPSVLQPQQLLPPASSLLLHSLQAYPKPWHVSQHQQHLLQQQHHTHLWVENGDAKRRASGNCCVASAGCIGQESWAWSLLA